jgi:hypothetical protein
MNDTALREMADRIQARAIRRAGELLLQIPAGQGARDGKRQEGTLPPLSRTTAAPEAGLSEHQRRTALRVANVPRPEFETAVERPRPATVTELAERGKQPRPAPAADHLDGAASKLRTRRMVTSPLRLRLLRSASASSACFKSRAIEKPMY